MGWWHGKATEISIGKKRRRHKFKKKIQKKSKNSYTLSPRKTINQHIGQAQGGTPRSQSSGDPATKRQCRSRLWDTRSFAAHVFYCVWLQHSLCRYDL